MRFAPGKRIPDHGHHGSEMTLILAGAYIDEFGRFARGDIADLGDDVEHSPHVEGEEDYICLVAMGCTGCASRDG